MLDCRYTTPSPLDWVCHVKRSSADERNLRSMAVCCELSRQTHVTSSSFSRLAVRPLRWETSPLGGLSLKVKLSEQPSEALLQLEPLAFLHGR